MDIDEKIVRDTVVEVLQEVLDSGYDLGGMGEYGSGWNDRGVQIRMKVREMMRRWRGES